MQTNRRRVSFVKPSALALSGLIVLSALPFQSQAAEQAKPGPEHKKLEMWAGEWKYEGVGEVTPFSQTAGKFTGTTTSRMVLGGFFLQGESKDISEDGYVWQALFMIGYDPHKKAYVFNGFENDGTHVTEGCEVSGNAWTTEGIRTGLDGKEYETKCVTTFSSDGKSQTEVLEYSADGGKTWAVCYRATFTKVTK